MPLRLENKVWALVPLATALTTTRRSRPDDRGGGVGKAGVVGGRRRPAGKESIGQGIWIWIDPSGSLTGWGLGVLVAKLDG